MSHSEAIAKPSGLSHSFDCGIAESIGLEEAVVYNHLVYWLKYNKLKGQNQHEGKTWTYESADRMADFLTYMTPKRIWRALEELVKHNVLIKGNFNKNKFDRTTWYALVDESPIQVSKKYNDDPVLSDAFSKNGKCNSQEGKLEVPNSETVIYTDKKKHIERTIPPTEGAHKRVASLPRSAPSDPNALSFSFEIEDWVNLTDDQIKTWELAYPNINVRTELLQMKVWIVGNKKRKGRKKDFHKFIIGWLNDEDSKAYNRVARLDRSNLPAQRKNAVDRRRRDKFGNVIPDPDKDNLDW